MRDVSTPGREQSTPLPSPRISRMPSRLGDFALAHLQGFGDFALGEMGSVIAFDQQGTAPRCLTPWAQASASSRSENFLNNQRSLSTGEIASEPSAR
jgi:hypothetical protein